MDELENCSSHGLSAVRGQALTVTSCSISSVRSFLLQTCKYSRKEIFVVKLLTSISIFGGSVILNINNIKYHNITNNITTCRGVTTGDGSHPTGDPTSPD